jgi:hypothetical protein
VVIVRPAKTQVTLECGGSPMTPLGAEAPREALSQQHAAGTLVGKRYIDEESDMEALCSRGGEGSLAVDGRPMTVKEAKRLPSSD